MMNEIETLKYQWEVIPEDAFDTQVENVDFADASRENVYGRFKRKDSSYSCQLVFARSQLIPKKKDSTTSRTLCSIGQYPYMRSS